MSPSRAAQLMKSEPPAVATARIEPLVLRAPVDSIVSQTLHVANQLQCSLEVDAIFDVLHREIDRIVPVSGLRYTHPGEGLDLLVGSDGPQRLSYELTLVEHPLGTVELRRAQAFSEAEIERLETLLCALVYPLRNALLYRRALETAYRDPVTGVNNRAAMNVTLTRDLDLAVRHGHPLSLIMLDIDHFKAVNDGHGHLVGDVVLRGVADTLRQTVRGSDQVFRYGGEEFCVGLPNTDLEGALLLAGRLREAVERQVFNHGGLALRLTASLGVASLAPGEHLDALLLRVDAALYEAKRQGRNRVVEHRG